MAKDSSIQINNLQAGIAQSSIFGFKNIRNLNVSDIPGIVYPNYTLSNETNSLFTDRPNAMQYYDGKYYLSDNDAALYWNGGTAGAWAQRTTSFSQGRMVVWRNYLVGLNGTSLNFLDTLGNKTTISSSVTASTGGAYMVVLMSDSLYIFNGENVSKLSEEDGETFDPSSSSTYELEKDKLKLNSGEVANCSTVWNSNIIIGGSLGNLYVWNGVSDLPSDIAPTTESTVQRLITINRRVYCQIGKFGNWYFFDGVRVQLVKKMPEDLFRYGTIGKTLQPEAVAEVDNKIYFGMDVSSQAGEIAGVYSLDLQTGALVCEDQLSTDADNDDITIGVLFSRGDKQYYVGWEEEDGTPSYGLDLKSTSATYTDDKAYFESQYYTLSTNEQKITSKLPIILFSEPLTSGDSAKIYYREKLNDSYTLLDTVNTVGITRKTLKSLPPLESVQMKVVLNGNIKFTNLILK